MKAIPLFRSILLLIGLFCVLIFCFADSQTHRSRAANAQTIPIVDLADLDFAVTVGAKYVSPGEVVPFYITITNSFSLPLENFQLVTSPPAHTTFSQENSSENWLESGMESVPCADGNQPGQLCYFTINSLDADAAVTITFAVRIDRDIPANSAPISLQANIYAVGQGPTAPPLPSDPPSGQGNADGDPNRPASRILYLPLIE